jgi:hypothetical protein
MKFMERFEKKQPLISKEEQVAFQELGKEIIFTEDVDLSLTPENIPALSEAVQQQFIDIQEKRRRKNMMEFYQITRAYPLVTGEEWKEKIKEYDVFTPSLMKLSEKDFLTHMYLHFGMTVHFDQGNGYDSRGFTPKLAQYENEENVEANCVGYTTQFGAYCKKRGLKIELGVTPDHPVVIAEADGKKYIVDGQLPPVELHGVFEQKDGYKIYRVSSEDRIERLGKEEGEEDEPLDQKLIMVHDFNQAVMYEVFENVAIFSDIAKDAEADTVPGSRREVHEAAKKHAGVLQKADWRSMQAKLFPTIERSFAENKTEWDEEISRMKDFRKKERKDSVMLDILFTAQNETSLKGVPFKEAQKDIREMSHKYKNEIKAFFIYSFEWSAVVPDDIKAFFTSIKGALNKEDVEVAKYIRDRIWSKIGG